MKARHLQIFIYLLVFSLFPNQVWTADWIQYASPSDGKTYYDKSSIKEIDKNIIRVSIKIIYSENGKIETFSVLKSIDKAPEKSDILSYQLREEEINCANIKVKSYTVNFYNKEDHVFYKIPNSVGEWRDIVSDSHIETLKNIVCTTGNNSTAMGESAADWFQKAGSLWVGGTFIDAEMAIEYLNNAIKLKPDYADAYNNRGVAYKNNRQYQQAIDDYNQAIRLKPDYADTYNNRGVCYYAIGQYERAIMDYREAIRLRTDYANAYNNIGIAYHKLGQYERAMKNYVETIRLKPDDANGYYNKACLFSLQKKYKQTCELLLLAIKRGYNNWKNLKDDKDLENVRKNACFIDILNKTGE